MENSGGLSANICEYFGVERIHLLSTITEFEYGFYSHFTILVSQRIEAINFSQPKKIYFCFYLILTRANLR